MSDNMNQDIRHFDSPVFGPVRDATNDEKKDIEALADVCPHALFAALNKRLNARGFLISIAALDANEVQPLVDRLRATLEAIATMTFDPWTNGAEAGKMARRALNTMDQGQCKGAWELGTACGKCSRCEATKPGPL